MKHVIALFFSAVVFCFVGCGGSIHRDGTRIPEGTVIEKLNIVSYNLVRKKVFQPYCSSCHSGKEKPELKSYDQVKDKLSAIHHSVFELADGEKKKMPPKTHGPLPPNAKNILLTWIKMDAPEKETLVPEPNFDGKSDPIDPMLFSNTVTWDDVRRDVFEKSCNRCHSAGNDWNAVDYTKADEVRGVFNSIMTFVLFGNAMPPRQDPPKPLPADWLDNETLREDPNPNTISQEQKILLYKWFLNGLK